MREEKFSRKSVMLNLDEIREIQPLAHALSTELRLQILCLIVNRGMSINEIARALEVPVSTVALNVQVLENAGVIECETQPGVRGTQKLCTRKLDQITFRLWMQGKNTGAEHVYEMPVGCYSHAYGIKPTCGLAAEKEDAHMMDSPAAFFHPMRFQAQLLWMREGYVEYSFPNVENVEKLEYLEFSFEACSEASGYRSDWPSDIYVCINGVELGNWICPGDMAGHRGRFTPEWWPEASTQYGFLKSWRVDHFGSMLDNEALSRVSLKDLKLEQEECIRLRIGTRKIGDHAGGLNLFGKGFGDYAQDILMRAVEKNEK